ncbi:MAG: TetR/AcrR family transcriptional regulator [Dermabacter sp.]|nr:TetR/AcrR family transcriptional regulator [Dermabacter sp.]
MDAENVDVENTDAKRPPGRPLNASLGPAIVNAVLSTLADGGYAHLTTAAVAERAGVSKATLYRRWPSKRDLILAAAAQIAADTEPTDEGSLRDQLRALLNRKREALSGRVGATLIVLIGEAAHDPELTAVLRESVFDPTHRHLLVILERAESRGERVSPLAAEPAAHLIVGTILSTIAFGPGGREGTEPHAILSDREVEMLVRAITERTAA